MSESFSVWNAGSGSQQASAENLRLLGSQNRRGDLFPVLGCGYLHAAASESRGRSSCWEQASVGKEVGLDGSAIKSSGVPVLG